MSFIISYITDNFVAIAADKRTTYRRLIGDTYDDTAIKVTKKNEYIYATCGHVNKIDEYINDLDAENFDELENYTDKYFNDLDVKRQRDITILNTIKLQIHICTAGKLIVYMIFPGEKDFLKAIVPINSRIASFSAPNISDNRCSSLEKYTEENYPSTIEEARILSEECIYMVSILDSSVSKEFDFEFIESRI